MKTATMNLLLGTCSLGLSASLLAGESPSQLRPFPDGTWSNVYDGSTPGPSTREHTSLWVDQQGQVHIYGGLAYRPTQFTPIYDHWTLTEAGWVENTQPLPPNGYWVLNEEGKLDLGEGKEPGTGGVLQLGIAGQDAQLILREPSRVPVGDKVELRVPGYILLRLDTQDGVTTWSPVTSTADPLAELGNFVYDKANDQYLYFCGINWRMGYAPSCETVYSFRFTNPEKTLGEWTVLTNSSGVVPPSRYGAAAVYDEVNQRTVVFGGGSMDCKASPVCARQDLWFLKVEGNNYNWTRIDIESPQAGRNGCWAYDAVKNRMFLTGQTPDAWNSVQGIKMLDLTLGSEKWEHYDFPSEIKTRSSCRATYDRQRHRILFGFGNNAIQGALRDIWSLQLQ